MATNNTTIDYNNLEAYHRATVWPETQDVYFETYPVTDLFYRFALTGSLDGAAEMKSYADELNKATIKSNKQLINSLTFEVPVKFLPLSGEVNGPGSQTLTNPIVENTTKAREVLNRKYQPAAIPEDEWEAGQSGGTAEQRALTGSSQMSDAAGSALKTQMESIETDLLGSGTSASAQVLALNAGIGISATDTTTYMGISRAATGITAWRGNFDAVTDANWIDETNGDFCWNVMGKHQDTVTANGAMQRDLVWIMGSTKFQHYRRALQGSAVTTNARFDVKSGRGIPHADLYYGEVPVIHAPKAGASTAYLVDMKTTILVGLENSLFSLMKWTFSENSTKVFSRMKTYSNVFVTHPNRNVYIAAS